jgi:polysaccharide export outer membrane protein
MIKPCFPLLLLYLGGFGLGLSPASALARSQNTATQPVLSAAPAPAARAAPSAAPPAKLGPGSVSPDYVLAPEDSIEITVWKEPALSGTLPIRPDGMITLALVGDLRAAGFTPMALSGEIAGRLKKFVNDPSVTVTVMGVHVDKVFMLGEIGHVGAIPLTPGLTPLQAISDAGGLTPYANAKHIYILRNQGGQQKRIPFNYKKALKTGDEQGVSLLPGDTIVIP